MDIILILVPKKHLFLYNHNFYLVPPDAVIPLAPECRDNSECPPHTACINRQCLNPCAVLDPCATNAYCRVQNHEPVCTCPPGYLGDPRVSCTKRKLFFFLDISLYKSIKNIRYWYKYSFKTNIDKTTWILIIFLYYTD